MKYGARAINIYWRSALFLLLAILLAGYPSRFGGYLAEAATQPDFLSYPQAAPAAPPPSPNYWGVLLQMVLSLIVVIGLVLVLVKLLQRNNLLSRQSAWAKVVDQVAIGPNKMLVLAEIFGKVYVLGVTDHNISTLLGENEIDLSQLKQVVADVERKRAMPAYFHKPFLQILESKIQDLKRSYPGGGKDGQPR